MKNFLICVKYLIWVILSLAVLNSCVSKEQQVVLPVGEVLDSTADLKQGLSVYYRYSLYRHITDMPSDYSMISEGRAGQPVKWLNHKFKRKVFDSNDDIGVGVFLRGYLKMTKPGTYRFKAMSNDGVLVKVNGQVVAYDPTVHSDRFSEIGQITISEAGWYPITVKYFQRKGSARLELHWQPPGLGDFQVVPASVYGQDPLDK